MSLYISAFIHGIRKYTNGFPTTADLPSAIVLQDIGVEKWDEATKLNFANGMINEQPVPLCSVFQFLAGRTSVKEFAFHKLELTEESIFTSEHAGNFSLLDNDFRQEWGKLKELVPQAFENTLIYLTEKYFANVGCSEELPHVSAFEFIKTNAALIDCINRGQNQELLLLGVGLDNIQAFCYDIASNKAVKSLKGRSFFLQMLLDTVASEIIRHPAIEATFGHIIYARGGKMYLLLPRNGEVKAALEAMRNQISDLVWKEFKASIYLYFEYVELSYNETEPKAAWKSLFDKIRHSQKRKHENRMISHFSDYFNTIHEGFDAVDETSEGGKQFCRVSGELIEKASRQKNNLEADDTQPLVWVSESVKFQSELGGALRETKHYSIWQKNNLVSNSGFYTFTGSDSFLALPGTDKLEWIAKQNGYQILHDQQLNGTDFLPEIPNKEISYGFTFYGGNDQATILENGKERVKQFSELAGEESQGFRRLGICRMDVDSLGIFVQKALSSFALNATMSSKLGLFLSGYVNKIREDNDDYKNYLNIVYSGGDDLLIIGRWDLVVQFVEEFRIAFRDFLDGDVLTFSAGIVLISPKYPIAKGVEEAGRAEDAAKDFWRNGKNRDALNFLGENMGWEEFPKVKKQKDELVKFYERGKISSGFLNQFMSLKQVKDYHLNNPLKKSDLSFKWRSAYYLSKVADNYKDSESNTDIREFLKNLSDKLFLFDREYDFVALAARWASLEIRQKETEKQNHI